jgi:primosomal protein N' (replication factor Y) (superfamily II helicase)
LSHSDDTQPGYVQVAVNVPGVSGVYDYHLNRTQLGQVRPGCLVVVPFGGQQVQGVVLSEVETPQVTATRPVDDLLDPEPVVTQAQINLARWLSEHTLAALSSCMKLMLPPGLAQQADTIYHLTERDWRTGKPFSASQQRIIKLLQDRGDLRGRQLDAALPRRNWKAAIGALVRRGRVVGRPMLLPPDVRPKMVRTARLICSPAEVETRREDFGRGQAGARRAAILAALLTAGGEAVPTADLFASSGGKAADLKRLEALDLIVIGEQETVRNPVSALGAPMFGAPPNPPPLTRAQESVWEALAAALEDAAAGKHIAPQLLHGVTGSGKTEVYLRAVERTLALGRQALILIPEIALSPQTVQRFAVRFPGLVGLVHSRLSSGERYDTWRRARSGELKVVVGPRSALFTPLPDVGLVVVDEFHDESYYQSDMQPTYHAVEAALAYARISGGAALLGSATPDISLMHRAAQQGWPILRLPARILAHRETVQAQALQLGISLPDLAGETSAASLPLPPVEVVDMRAELKSGNTSIFSRPLQAAIEQVLERDQQAIMYLNRRGSATYVFCRDCGYSLRCPRCEVSLTHHQGQEALVCHHCGYRRRLPKICPQCSGTRIRQFGTGTEKVAAEVENRFPGVRTLRWDWEATRAKGAHDDILSAFSRREADILVGTQMLAKGLDLPLVTLVGVVLADVGLNLPDYRVGERVFQLLTQVAGRAGRSPLGGQVILQTFDPDHYVIQAAAGYDFAGFSVQELARRRDLGYPPFYRLVRLEYRQRDPARAESAARSLAAQLAGWLKSAGQPMVKLIGPTPCFFSRVGGEYRWQIVLRGADPAAVLRGRALPPDWRLQVDPPSLL